MSAIPPPILSTSNSSAGITYFKENRDFFVGFEKLPLPAGAAGTGGIVAGGTTAPEAGTVSVKAGLV
jgi:hypothetical protein